MAKTSALPWSLDPIDGSECHLLSAPNGFCSDVIATIHDVDLPIAKANAARIVDCVNACEGLADPSVVPELVEMIERCVTMRDEYWHDDAMALVFKIKAGQQS